MNIWSVRIISWCTRKGTFAIARGHVIRLGQGAEKIAAQTIKHIELALGRRLPPFPTSVRPCQSGISESVLFRELLPRCPR